MDASWKKRESVPLSIPEDLLARFGEVVEHEGLSMAKLVGQLLHNYAEYLDRSILGTAKPRPRGRGTKAVSFLLPEAIVARAREKARREDISLSALLQRIIENYVDFVQGKGGSSPLPRQGGSRSAQSPSAG